MPTLFIDILVTTYQRAVDLAVLMKNLEQQRYPHFRLQVFDGSHDDTVRKAVEEYLSGERALKYNLIFHKTPSGMTRQRNIAVDHTEGDISIFLDDDVELESDYLEKVVLHFEKMPDLAGLNGFDTVGTKTGKPGKRKSLYRMLGLLPDIGPARYLPWGHSTSHFLHDQSGTRDFTEVDVLIGHNMAFRTKLLKQYRFAEFYEDYPTYVLYDDQDLCLRLRKNFVLILSYAARLKHNVSPAGRPPQKHYGFQAFFNAHRNWKLYGGKNAASVFKFWLWEFLDIILQLPGRKTRNISIGRLNGIFSVVKGVKRYAEIKNNT